MKKRTVAVILAQVLGAMAVFSGCGERTDEPVIEREEQVAFECIEGCTCTCACCEAYRQAAGIELDTVQQTETAGPEETVQPTETQSTAEVMPSDIPGTEESTPEPTEAVQDWRVGGLSDGEKAARKEQQANFAAARQTLYSLPNSVDKTTKITQMDRQILANNAYDFGNTNVVFIGDSITEGIEGAVDDNGNFVSYVTYVNSYLHFLNVLNHGKGGRMFADYGGEELSIALNFGSMANEQSDMVVVFAGINDYLSTPPSKRFGNVDEKSSTAGYCGGVRYFMRRLYEEYPDNDVFVVMMYNVSKTATCTYSDVTGQLSLNDYLEVQRKIADEYGFHIIDLYGIGFMDCTDPASADYYLRDGLHPKDNGNIALGEHIAAEISLYMGQKE